MNFHELPNRKYVLVDDSMYSRHDEWAVFARKYDDSIYTFAVDLNTGITYSHPDRVKTIPKHVKARARVCANRLTRALGLQLKMV